MADIAHALGMFSALLVGAFAVSFGLYAGLKAATWAFGAIDVNISRSENRKAG